jgi:metacaspase-1
MTQKIALDALMAMVDDPTVDEEELAPYFKTVGGDAPFQVSITVNPTTVEIPADTRSAGLLSLANSAARQRRRRKYEHKMLDGKYTGPVIVSEGDSWFQYPILLKDTIDWLMEDYAILSLDAAGDTMANMAKQAEYRQAVEKTNADMLLLSAGGNDLLADGNIVRHFAQWMPGKKPDEILLPSFDTLVRKVVGSYQAIFQEFEASRPALQIFVHGYDNPLPRQNGQWIGEPMIKHGISDPAFRDALVREMMTRFNNALQLLASHFPAVHYVDARGAVSQWHDELHPVNASYQSVASRFAAEIKESWTPKRAQAPASKGASAKAAPAAVRGRRGFSLHAGLNTNDPAGYPAIMELQAAEFDAQDMDYLAGKAGIGTRHTLIGTDATVNNFKQSMQGLAEHAEAQDFVMITYSGHGGFIDDYSGEETDFRDETLCLYDKMLLDDELFEMLAAFRQGVRVMLISDSCHSGTIYRMTEGNRSSDDPPPGARTLSRSALAKAFRANEPYYTGVQANLAARGWSSADHERAIPISASVRVFSGCQDNQFSMDGQNNGAFTGVLKSVWQNGAFSGNYDRLFSEVAGRMRDPSQSPKHTLLGPDNPIFNTEKPFTV